MKNIENQAFPSVVKSNPSVVNTTLTTLPTTLEFSLKPYLKRLKALYNTSTLELSTQWGCVPLKNKNTLFKAFKGLLHKNIYTHPLSVSNPSVVVL